MPLLVWLMAAVPKGYALGRMLALACLSIIHEIASVPVRDQHTTGEPPVRIHCMLDCSDEKFLQAVSLAIMHLLSSS